MIAALLSSDLAQWVAGAVGVFAGIVALWFAGKREGRQAARADAAAAEAKDYADTRKRIDNAVDPDLDLARARERLRQRQAERKRGL